MLRKETIAELVSKVLDGKELRLRVDSYTLKENLENGVVELECHIHDERTGEREVIVGRGVGLVDAAFQGLVALYSARYPSLRSFRLADFTIKANVDSAHVGIRSDMAAVVTLLIENAEGREFAFTHASPSITRSSLAVVAQFTEFFVNCERAFLAVYHALQHASDEKRADSVAYYTSQMTTLVEATSYTDVIETVRQAAVTRGEGKSR